MEVFGAKPEPETVTDELGVKLVEDSVIEPCEVCDITLNDAVAVPRLLKAEIVWLPTLAVLGIVMLAVNVPVAVVVIVAGLVATIFPSNLIVIATLGAKPDPVTVMVVPTLLLVGDNEIKAPDPSTVNVAAPNLPVSSLADIV